MKIEEIRVERSGKDRLKVSSFVNEDWLWFDIPEGALDEDRFADSFMIMGLAGSMLKGEPLIVSSRYSVSRTLVEKMHQIQKILSTWNPAFRRVPIEASVCDRAPAPGQTASFFSGGVDSIAAVMNQSARIESGVYVGGFDFDLEEEAFTKRLKLNRRILEVLGKDLIVVRSNQQPWGTRTGVRRDFWYSGYLAAAGFLCGPTTLLVPSSHTFSELEPNGSHLILDGNWDSGEKRLEHVDAELSRVDKLRMIASVPEVLAMLHVCWNDPSENCGVCGKCIRTMVTFDLLGVKGPFPRQVKVDEVARINAKTWQGLGYLIENAALAAKVGRTDMLYALRQAIRRYDRSKAIEYVDRGVLFGVLRRLRKRFRPYSGRIGFTNRRPDLDL